MILKDPKGRKDLVRVEFHDWTPDMMALSSRLHQLPRPNGLTYHEVGIDHLNSLPGGPQAVADLFFLIDEDFQECPDGAQVLQLGRTLIEVSAELNALAEDFHLERAARRNHQRNAVSKRPPRRAIRRTAGPVGFVRRN